MPQPLPLADLALSPHASRFEGRDHGSTVSFFVTAHPPGRGATLHRHPYEETFLVQDGSATFTAGAEQIGVDAGHILVVPANTPHGFKNTGEGLLRIVSIHPSDHVIQESLEE